MPKSVPQPVQPLPGYVVLKEHKLDNKIAGRLYIPPGSENAPSLGEVVLIGGPRSGPDTDEFLFDSAVMRNISVNDIVAYQNYGGQELTLDNVKYLLVPFDKLLAKVSVKE